MSKVAANEDTDELDQWTAVVTRAEAVKLYATMQQLSLHGIKSDNVSKINEILISKFGMAGLQYIKKRAVKRLGMN